MTHNRQSLITVTAARDMNVETRLVRYNGA